MRFVIHYRRGNKIQTDVIEANTLDEAEKKADKVRPHWEDIRFQNTARAEEILSAL